MNRRKRRLAKRRRRDTLRRLHFSAVMKAVWLPAIADAINNVNPLAALFDTAALPDHARWAHFDSQRHEFYECEGCGLGR